jgi:GMP synthase (glutamine-hydrolysing)
VVGRPPEPVEAERGGYGAWFGALLERNALLRAHPVDGVSGPLRIDLRAYAGVLITGSAASVAQPEPWMEAAVELVRGCYETGTPLLGVCFGHQIIGAATGGSVIANPLGWEMATQSIELTPAGRSDPLFVRVPGRFAANLSHRDVVVAETLPPTVAVLACNAKSAVQALALGDAVRGVQFHPEIDGAIAREFIRVRSNELRADAAARGAAQDDPEQLLGGARDCPHAVQVLDNWVREFVLRS